MHFIFAIGVAAQAVYNVTWTNVKPNIVRRQGRANVFNTPGPRVADATHQVDSSLES